MASDPPDRIERMRALLALGGHDPTREQAAAAIAEAQALRGPGTVSQWRHWFLKYAAPCPWVIQICCNLAGQEYPTVIPADMLTRQRNTETLPTWRLVEVPLAFRASDPSDILAACHNGKIAWRP